MTAKRTTPQFFQLSKPYPPFKSLPLAKLTQSTQPTQLTKLSTHTLFAMQPYSNQHPKSTKQPKFIQPAKRTKNTLLALVLIVASPFVFNMPAMAERTVIINNGTSNEAEATNTNPSRNANSNMNSNDSNATVMANGTTGTTTPNNNLNNNLNNSINHNTLASQLQPTQDELSAANQQLLSRNAQLQRDVNALDTQVKVLVNEHSGQLFMYGAMTVIVAVLVGIFIGWLVFSRRERW